MKQYIDKSTLVAEIEERINKEIQSCATDSILGYSQGCIDSMRNVLSLISTLEVKKEILDKKGKAKLMKKCVHKAYKRGYNMGVLQTTNKMNNNIKEVDLEKEANEAWDYIFSHGWDENSRMALKHDEYMAFAQHFFELGVKTKGE